MHTYRIQVTFQKAVTEKCGKDTHEKAGKVTKWFLIAPKQEYKQKLKIVFLPAFSAVTF